MAKTDKGDKGSGDPEKKGVSLIMALVLLTLLAGGTGGGLGMVLAYTVKQVAAEQAKSESATGNQQLRYNSDMVLTSLRPVVVNLASPTNVWLRIESAIVFKNGDLANPDVAAAQIREDILTYARTLNIAQLEGPSALQNLREDLNERAQLRVEGKLTELIIETLVVQ